MQHMGPAITCVTSRIRSPLSGSLSFRPTVIDAELQNFVFTFDRKPTPQAFRMSRYACKNAKEMQNMRSAD
jgi:hypothetical protein